jgi:hypothetical protein
MRLAALAFSCLVPVCSHAACPTAPKLIGVTYQIEELQFLPNQNVRAVLTSVKFSTSSKACGTYYAAAESGSGSIPLEEGAAADGACGQELAYTYSATTCRGTLSTPGGGARYSFTVDGSGVLHGIGASTDSDGTKARQFRGYKQ